MLPAQHACNVTRPTLTLAGANTEKSVGLPTHLEPCAWPNHTSASPGVPTITTAIPALNLSPFLASKPWQAAFRERPRQPTSHPRLHEFVLHGFTRAMHNFEEART